jgi:DNA-binding transcriptional MerR regulator
MKINEFAKKHDTSVRNIDYWTTEGLLHPALCGNGHRDYDETCDKEMKLIIIAKAMNVAKLSDTVDMLRHIPKGVATTFVTKSILEEKKKATKMYDDAIDYVNELLRG